MIRCAVVSSYMGPYISNYILSELAIERKFREQGDYIFHVFPKDVEDKEWVQLFRDIGAKLYFIDYKPLSWSTIKTLRKIFNEEKINIIHSHFGGFDVDARLAAPLTPMVLHQRMYVRLTPAKRRFKYWLFYNIFNLFRTRSISISQAVHESISTVTSMQNYCIPNCIDFDRLHPDLSRIGQTKQADGKFRLLLFGYSPNKGLDIAFKACETLVANGVNVELAVVAQGGNENDYISRCYSPYPEWLKVLQPISDVSSYYNAADVFLSASRSEGFCNALLEAIYCGCPVIFSDIPGTKWAHDFKHTFEYAVESPDALAEAVMKCIASPITVEEVDYNQRKAHELYSMETWVNNVYEVLSDFHSK